MKRLTDFFRVGGTARLRGDCDDSVVTSAPTLRAVL